MSYHEAISATTEAGVLIVAAAGNTGIFGVSYPAKYPEVIAVSATDNKDAFAYYSTFGPEVDLAAPGALIYSTYKGDAYATMSGTSMATPFVTGVAALVISIDDDNIWTPAEIEAKLEASAENIVGLTADEQGAGLVDAEKAVLAN